jgi:hypothetical protein
MKKSLLYLTACLGLFFSSCSDDSDILTGKTTPSGATNNTNTNNGVSNAKTCSLKELQKNDNGDISKSIYTYNASGVITKVSNDWGDFNVEYDKNNQITKMVFVDDKNSYFEFINDSKGNLTSINLIFYDTDSKKTFTVKNGLTLNSAGQISQYKMNLDIFTLLLSGLFGGDIKLENEVIPFNFIYNKDGNLTKVTLVDGKTEEVLIENTEFDAKKNPYTSATLYRMNLVTSLLAIGFEDVTSMNIFNKNNVIKTKSTDEDGKPITLTYGYEYSADNYPTKSTLLIKDSAGEKKIIETYSYDCK